MLLWRKNQPIQNRTDSPTEKVEANSGIFQRVNHATMTSGDRVTALCDAIDYLSNGNVAGAVVECGVWKGGSMMAAALRLIENEDHNRELWLFDTFNGMNGPSEFDVDFEGNAAEKLLSQSDHQEQESVWCYSELDEVKNNMNSTHYPPSLIRYIPGPVEETLLSESLPERISLLRLDTDWYESTKIELERLFPRLVPGGVLIIDDYGHWQGCQKAVDEYLADNNINILLNRIDYTGRIAVKLPNCSSRLENSVAS